MDFPRPASDNYHELDDLICWRREIEKTCIVTSPPHGVRSNPTVLNDMVVASVMKPGQVIALACSDGRELWRARLDSYGSPDVTVADQIIYATSSNTVSAISPDNGAVLWSWTPYGLKGEWIYSSPMVVDDRLVIGDRKGVLTCLDALSGTVLWQSQTSTDNQDVNATAVVVDDFVITATNAAIALAYELSTGQLRWKVQLDYGSDFQLQLWDNHVIIQAWNAVYLLDYRDGSVRHKWTWKDLRVNSTVVANDMLVSVFNIVNEIQGYDHRGQRFKLSDSHGSANLRYDPALRVVYETLFGGLGIISPDTGRRVHHINEVGFRPSLPTCDRGVLYCLGQKGKSGILAAVAYPYD